MWEKYMVLSADIQSVIENGVGTGFEVKIRIPYYRGISLSLIDDLSVPVSMKDRVCCVTERRLMKSSRSGAIRSC